MTPEIKRQKDLARKRKRDAILRRAQQNDPQLLARALWELFRSPERERPATNKRLAYLNRQEGGLQEAVVAHLVGAGYLRPGKADRGGRKEKKFKRNKSAPGQNYRLTQKGAALMRSHPEIAPSEPATPPER